MNIIKHIFTINKINRSFRNGQKPKLIWFTGLSGSGKSTLANLVEKYLFKEGFYTYSLDGDNIRSGLNKDLSFSEQDRKENIRRIGEVAKILLDAGLIVCASFISPNKIDRDNLKLIVGIDNFIEIYLNTPIKECENRDVKGLYAKARSGEIKNFTGISADYEEPVSPDLEIDTSKYSIEESVEIILKKILIKLK
jgi:adenylyl-sulfate kinase